MLPLTTFTSFAYRIAICASGHTVSSTNGIMSDSTEAVVEEDQVRQRASSRASGAQLTRQPGVRAPRPLINQRDLKL